MLQTLAVDHHRANRDTQDAMRGMRNSIDRVGQLLKDKFLSPDSNSQEGMPRKTLRGNLLSRENIITPKLNKDICQNLQKKDDFSMKSNNHKDKTELVCPNL